VKKVVIVKACAGGTCVQQKLTMDETWGYGPPRAFVDNVQSRLGASGDKQYLAQQPPV